MKKKLILSFLIAILMFNALLPSSIYADTTTDTTTTSTTTNDNGKGTSQTARNEVKRMDSNEVQSTKVPIGQNKDGTISTVGGQTSAEPGNFAGVIAKIIAKMFCLPPYGIQLMMAYAIKGDNEQVAGSLTEHFDATQVKWFTIEKSVFNKIPL